MAGNVLDGRARCTIIRGLVKEGHRPKLDLRIRPCQLSLAEAKAYSARTSDHKLRQLYCVGPGVIARIRELYGPYRPGPTFRASDV